MARTPSSTGLTGQALLATVQAPENQHLSSKALAVKCGFVTPSGKPKEKEYAFAYLDALNIFAGASEQGVRTERGDTGNTFKMQKAGLLTPRRFLKQAGCNPGEFASIYNVQVIDGTIDITDLDVEEGITSFVLIAKNITKTEEAKLAGKVNEDDEEGEDEEDDDNEEEGEEGEEGEDEEEVTPVPSTTVRIAQPA